MGEKITLEFEDDEKLKLNGIVYATAQRLAKRFGLSADRIAQLGRNGDIDAELFGRTWFMSERSLDHYLFLGRKGRGKARRR
jgi:hypothetical protein